MAGKMSKPMPKVNMSKPTPKVNMSKPAPKPAWKPQKGIPDQMKVKNPGAGWGGEKPNKKK